MKGERKYIDHAADFNGGVYAIWPNTYPLHLLSTQSILMKVDEYEQLSDVTM